MRLHRAASTLAASVSFCLFVCLLLSPNLIFVLFGIERTESAEIMSRRASMLFLGFSLICWLARAAENSSARQGIAAGLAAAMLGLAGIGLFEFVRGAVGPGVWLAIAGEVTIGSMYLRVWLTYRTLAHEQTG